MFACQNCLAVALRAVIHDGPAVSPRLAQHHSAVRTVHTSRLRAGTAVATLKASHGRRTKPGAELERVGDEKAVLSRYKPNHLRQELRWLGDPLKFADNTKQLLEKGWEEKAVELIRMAGRENSVVVAWNHLLMHTMRRGSVDQALKYFNEMKKRAQKPDAYTYSILLKGLADNHRVPSALDKAVSLYHSMSAPNSPVRPSLIHTNALMQVCGLTNALDRIFEIAAELPKRGPGAPDNITFAIILNSIRATVTDQNLRFGRAEPVHHAARERTAEAIYNGKRIWNDVIESWVRGAIAIDEGLVCAMGRLLLLSASVGRKAWNPKNVDEIPSLFEQAMGIPRQFPRQSWRSQAAMPSPKTVTPDSDEAADPDSSGGDRTAMQQLDQGNYDAEVDHPEEVQFNSIENESVFDPVPLESGRARGFARPGNSALSLILTTCGYLREYKAAQKYWDMLTGVVRPDQENCHALLRVLRFGRASRHSLVIVKQMRQPVSTGGYGVGVQAKTFRIAMSSCVRDHKNPTALDTALQLVQIMRDSLTAPDLQTVMSFATLLKARGRDTNVRLAMGGVEVLNSLVNNARSEHYYGDVNHSGAELDHREEQQSEDLVSAPSSKEQAKIVLSTHKAYEFVSIAEAATARSLDYYSEEIGTATRVLWQRRLKKLRRWLRKMPKPQQEERESRR